ncbi:MAG TPA: hypothetical protein PLB81_00455 [Deltaproteobacteria bacterium]|nr:hypothetical protein [Deltaproteobacteria bacterium]
MADSESGHRAPLLHYDPRPVFRDSTTPAGLYARQKWLDESHTASWRHDFQQTVTDLLNAQSADGSWQGSVLETVRRLFGLHLTVRAANADIDRALEWLMRHAPSSGALNHVAHDKTLRHEDLAGLPFVPGHPRLTIECAVLFLFSVFGRFKEPAVLSRYQRMSSRIITAGPGMEFRLLDVSNALRALVVHPDYAHGPSTAVLIEYLEHIQGSSGLWPEPTNIYLTFNALAHVNLEAARRQLLKAAGSVSRMQNEDGTWGEDDREWNTFLMVHALKNKGWL